MFNALIGLGATLIAPKAMRKFQDQKVTVVHASPGRVRLQCDKWKNEPTARNLETYFKTIDVVKSVEATSVSGSLLLTFQVPSLTVEQFDWIVKKAVEISVETYCELPSELDKGLHHTLDFLDTNMKKQTGGNIGLDGIVSTVCLVGGIMTIPTNLPFAGSLLYWSYSNIRHN